MAPISLCLCDPGFLRNTRPPQIRDGHCWVKTSSGSFGVLTARHVIEPNDAMPGSEVAIVSERKEVRGNLLHASRILDAAVIEVAGVDSSSVQSNRFGSTVGYKRVRFITGYTRVDDPQEADITGLFGFQDALYSRGNFGNEPLSPAIMFLNKSLDPGDSGCLIIDIESESYGHTHPYLIYLGAANYGPDKEAYGLFIAQAANEWSLSTCQMESGSANNHP